MAEVAWPQTKSCGRCSFPDHASDRCWLLAFAILSTGLMGGRALTPSSFLSTVDKDRLRKVFADSIAKEDLPSVAYAVLGYKLLGDTSVLEGAKADAICKKLQSGANSAEANVANAYQAASAAKELKGCKITLGQTASKVRVIGKIY